jgi:Fic family protein
MTPVRYHAGKFPPADLDWGKLVPLIGPASAAIAGYAGLLQGIPDPNVLLSPMTVQEAVLSSRIEGTQATMGEVLELEAEGGEPDESTQKKADIFEVLNYRAALNESRRLMETLPLSQRLIKDAHQVLMQGVRGRSKAPGEYRRIPNWIGPPGCTIEEARFVPASAEHLPGAMDRWERYLHDDQPDVLVQLAIAHAELEAIHPFLDGNGRIGRLFIPLFLVSKGLLTRPNFYLSEYLEANRDEYYERLLAISRDGDWTGWCAFFLKALIVQAKANQSRAQQILDLYNRLKTWIVAEAKSQHSVSILDEMFARPIFNASDFGASSGVPRHTTARILRVVRQHGVLRELRPASGRRAAVFCFPELINIAEGHDAV